VYLRILMFCEKLGIRGTNVKYIYYLIVYINCNHLSIFKNIKKNIYIYSCVDNRNGMNKYFHNTITCALYEILKKGTIMDETTIVMKFIVQTCYSI